MSRAWGPLTRSPRPLMRGWEPASRSDGQCARSFRTLRVSSTLVACCSDARWRPDPCPARLPSDWWPMGAAALRPWGCRVCCLLSVHVCLPRTRGRVETEPHASNAGAWLARMSSACFHESARLMTLEYDVTFPHGWGLGGGPQWCELLKRVFTPPRPVEGPEELNFARVGGGRPDLAEERGVGAGSSVSTFEFPSGNSFWPIGPTDRPFTATGPLEQPTDGAREPAAQSGVHTDTAALGSRHLHPLAATEPERREAKTFPQPHTTLSCHRPSHTSSPPYHFRCHQTAVDGMIVTPPAPLITFAPCGRGSTLQSWQCGECLAVLASGERLRSTIAPVATLSQEACVGLSHAVTRCLWGSRDTPGCKLRCWSRGVEGQDFRSRATLNPWRQNGRPCPWRQNGARSRRLEAPWRPYLHRRSDHAPGPTLPRNQIPAPCARGSAHELLIDRVLGLVEIGEAEVVEQAVELRLLLRRQRDAGQHLADLPAVVAVVEQRQEHLRRERAQEGGQRARVLRKLEADEPLSSQVARPGAGQVARVRLGHLKVGRVFVGGDALVGPLQRHVDHRLLPRRVPEDELGHPPRLHRLVQLEKLAGLVGHPKRVQALRLLAVRCALRDEAEDVELDAARVT
eukprot:scaffold3513_cov127-Isochrysis_galbana.AAC.5